MSRPRPTCKHSRGPKTIKEPCNTDKQEIALGMFFFME